MDTSRPHRYAPAPVISLCNVTLWLKDKPVLRNISLDVPQGGVFGLIGPGASGKSVLFKVITRLLNVSEGRVEVDGQTMAELDDDALSNARKKIGMLFQNNALFDHMSVSDNIGFPLRRLFDYSEAQISEIVAERLSRVSLAGFEDRFPPNLSGGQKKRVGIARATAQRAQIVLYDEPTAGLDPVNSQKIFNLIRDEQRAQGTTAVVISSDVSGLLTIADRVAMLHRGELLFSGTALEAQQSRIPAVQSVRARAYGRTAMSQNAQTTPFALLLPERVGKALLNIAEQMGGIGVLALMLARAAVSACASTATS